MDFLFAFLIGYISGSLPFAVWVGRLYGVDVLTQGSCNPGATNVLRLAGKKAGYIVFLLDALKGALAVFTTQQFLTTDNHWLPVVALGSALLGHSYSCFLKFKGGKGVATTIGGLMILTPLVLSLSLITWVMVFFIWRYVSLASIFLGVSLPIWTFFLNKPESQLISIIVVMLVIILRHRENIKRLWKGQEAQFHKSKS